MTNNKKTTLFGVCAVIFCLFISIAAVCFALSSLKVSAASSSNATISGYEAQLKDLENKEANLKKEIEKLKNDSSQALTMKLMLDSLLGATHEKIDAANALVAQLETQISDTESEITDMEAELSEQKRIFVERLRLAHEDSTVSYVAMLFDADGLSDFFRNVEQVGALLDYDRKVIDKFSEQKKVLETAKGELDVQMQKQTEYQATLEKSEEELLLSIKEADALLEKINADKDAYQSDLKAIKAEADKLEKELEEYLKKLQEQQNKDYMVVGQLEWPISTKSTGYNRITSTFGYRDLEVNGNDVSNHKGIDIGVRYVDLWACGKGTVLKAAYSESYGNYIIIDHGGGVSTLYAHLSKINVKKDDVVDANTKIGVTGNTGWSNGAHLHLELRLNGKYVDPLNTKDKYGVYYLSRPSNLYYVD